MIAETTQHIDQRLKGILRPMSAAPTLGAFALPNEIILQITSHLPLSSSTSLALTCRTLYRSCFPGQVLDPKPKEALLLLLEKDIPSLYFCHYCVKLHPWHRRWSRSLTPWYQSSLPCQRSFQNQLWLAATCHIPYYYARVVMNRHFYGDGHGPLPRSLEPRVCRCYHLDDVVSTQTQAVRIIDDELIVLSVMRVEHTRGNAVGLRQHIDDMGGSVCAHLTLQTGRPSYAPVQVPELRGEGTTSPVFRLCNGARGSCALCLIDYSIDISWRGEQNGYLIEVKVYRQLGGCRSPFDWSWNTMKVAETNEVTRVAYGTIYGPGSVQDQWNEGDGIVSSAQGAWVEIPGLVPESSRQRALRGDD